ncbi:ABC transporter ATP-binding protein [bacterium]|nr:ABC transporter ATP-binding protein [bacterium]
MELALEIKNLKKAFGDLLAVNDVSLKIEKGTIFGLLGPNGAGKSTIINIITGVSSRDSGKVNVFSHDVTTDYRNTRSSVGVVPQETISDGYFTVMAIMRFQSGFFGIRDNEKKITEILKRLYMWDYCNKRVEHLSGGMKRRLLIAKALVHDPEFLILDEPTAGVDVQLRHILWDYVRELNKSGTTVLLTTHYIEEASNLCDKVGIMNHGKIVALDTVKGLMEVNEGTDLEDVFLKVTGENVHV